MVLEVVSKVPNLQGGPRPTTDNLSQQDGPLHVQPGAGDHEVEAAGVGHDPAASRLQPLHPFPHAAASSWQRAGNDATDDQAGADD